MSMKKNHFWIVSAIVVLAFLLMFKLYDISLSSKPHYSSQLHLYQKDTLIHLSDNDVTESLFLMENQEVWQCSYTAINELSETELENLCTGLAKLSEQPADLFKEKIQSCISGQSVILIEKISLSQLKDFQSFTDGQQELALIQIKEKRIDEIGQTE